VGVLLRERDFIQLHSVSSSKVSFVSSRESPFDDSFRHFTGAEFRKRAELHNLQSSGDRRIDFEGSYTSYTVDES